LIDSHAHLDFPQFDSDREQVIVRARGSGITAIINVGADLQSSKNSIELAERYPFIFAAVGIHPHDAKTLDEPALQELQNMARHPRVVAIGEIGLDYYRDLSPRDKQQEAFERQLDLAHTFDLPFIIHDRDAHDDIMSVLEERTTESRPLRGVLHCFSGGVSMAQRALDIGLHISVGGPVTFRNARQLPEVVRQVPLSRLLLETDCPYLTPAPHRGKRNEPAYVLLVAQAVAALKEISLAEVQRVTTQNVRELFGLNSRKMSE
jgi:TatD DNase family protein